MNSLNVNFKNTLRISLKIFLLIFVAHLHVAHDCNFIDSVLMRVIYRIHNAIYTDDWLSEFNGRFTRHAAVGNDKILF